MGMKIGILSYNSNIEQGGLSRRDFCHNRLDGFLCNARFIGCQFLKFKKKLFPVRKKYDGLAQIST